MSAKPIFKDIKFDEATSAAVDAFAKKRDIPALVFPRHAESTEGQGRVAATVMSIAQPKAGRKAKVKHAPTTAPVQRLAVELPAYLVKDVGDKAHDTGVTIRFIVANALRKAGFHVAEEDLKEDGRRAR